MFEISIKRLEAEIASEEMAQSEMIAMLPEGQISNGLLARSKERVKSYKETIETLKKLPQQLSEIGIHANDCPECHVSLNKDGSCPSCEQDHADNVREAGQGK